MTDRERWIVYPLLFLALGAALRDKLAKQTRAKDIVCEHLYLVDAEGRPAALLTGTELRFDLGGEGNGFVRSNTIDAQGLFQRGQPVVTFTPRQGLSLQQLMQLLPQLRVVPGLPQAPDSPQDDAPRREMPAGPLRPAPGADAIQAEPGPAA